MLYPIAIELGTRTTSYGVVVPDLPGCYSAGDTLDEAMSNAREAIELYLEDVIDAGKAPPAPSRLEVLRADKAFSDWTWALVSVDLAKLSSKATRVNITIPDRLLGVIDSYTTKRGENRSAFLVRAALAAMASEELADVESVSPAVKRATKAAAQRKRPS